MYGFYSSRPRLSRGSSRRESLRYELVGGECERLLRLLLSLTGERDLLLLRGEYWEDRRVSSARGGYRSRLRERASGNGLRRVAGRRRLILSSSLRRSSTPFNPPDFPLPFSFFIFFSRFFSFLARLSSGVSSLCFLLFPFDFDFFNAFTSFRSAIR